MTEGADSRAGIEALIDILSVERFGRYLYWTGRDHQWALDLCALNTRLSEALYTSLQMLEVVLRNRIAHHEPILHWDLRRHHAVIQQTMAWLAPEAADWCAGMDRFPSVHPEESYTLFTPSRANE